MKPSFDERNPFRRTFRLDHAFVWEQLAGIANGRAERLRVLDYGAHDGKMLRACIGSGLEIDGYGVDANKAAIALGTSRGVAGEPLVLGDVSELEAFASRAGGFDVVCLMGVLEHVLDQTALLERLRSVLRPGGKFIVSVPGKHFLSWLDFGNWKFYFPGLHRFFVTRTRGEAHYRERFVECRNGLFGDIEVGKGEHQHFSRPEITALLAGNGFEIESVDGYGFSYRLLHNLWWMSPGVLKRLWEPVIRLDLRHGGLTELVVLGNRPA